MSHHEHDNVKILFRDHLTSEHKLGEARSTASAFLGKHKPGHIIYMMQLSKNEGFEVRFGFFKYQSDGIPETKMRYGIIITSDKDFTDGELDTIMTLIEHIHDDTESDYQMMIADILLEKPHVRYHKCHCGGPTFNGPHVNKKIRAKLARQNPRTRK